MSEERQKIKSFTDLIAQKEGHKLVLIIYKATEKFLNKELFALTSQLRRAAVSITSNIAEGFCRNSVKNKGHFYNIAQGSVAEVENQMIIARDIGYIKKR